MSEKYREYMLELSEDIPEKTLEKWHKYSIKILEKMVEKW